MKPPSQTKHRLGWGTAQNHHSKVWFMLSERALEKIGYPNLSSPRFRQWQRRVADRAIPLQNASQVEPVEEDSLAFWQLLKDSEGRFGLNQTVITRDPLRQSLVLQVQQKALSTFSRDLCLSLQPIEGRPHFRTSSVRERQALLLPQVEGTIAYLPPQCFWETRSR